MATSNTDFATSTAIVVLFIATPPSIGAMDARRLWHIDAGQVAGGVHSIIRGGRAATARRSTRALARREICMAKHYVYRMDHDTGFAPHVSENICTLCGCKTTTVEAWAEPGSWVIGIGGRGKSRPDALIYAMRGESKPTLPEF